MRLEEVFILSKYHDWEEDAFICTENKRVREKLIVVRILGKKYSSLSSASRKKEMEKNGRIGVYGKKKDVV